MVFIGFPRNLFVGKERSLGRAQIDKDVAALDALDSSGNNIVFPIGILFVDHPSLCFADALDNDLFGILGSNAAKVLGRHFFFHNVPRLIARVQLERFVKADFGQGIFHFRYDIFLRIDVDFPIFLVHGNPDILSGAEILLIGCDERLFHRTVQYVRRNMLLLGQLRNGSYKIRIHL